jgi:hypothetical protein
MISKGTKSYDDISKIRQADIAAYYLGVKSIPCLISSPLRKDNKPSFCLFSNNGEEVGFIDYSTKEHGSIFKLLMLLWDCDIIEVRRRIANDLGDCNLNTLVTNGGYFKGATIRDKSDIDIKCRVRPWQSHDIEYWESYGISLKWLKYADVYPISHKIVVKNGINYIYGADKYAYVYVEFKEGKTTLKVYQPFNTKGFKWANRHDKSVISLWTKVPKSGDRVCICSSLKDALCLWANTGIPSLAIQGEGYGMSNTAINELKRRFNRVYILLDNDPPGLEDAKNLASKTGFINVVLPPFNEGKDISDLYHSLHDKNKFKELILGLFN